MTDVERLKEWMQGHGYSMKGLSQETGVKYITLYYMTERRKEISDRFAIAFIRRFGCDEATRVLADFLAPIDSLPS